jgi:acetoin utilization deacetylase AcuC-like enzyme
LRTIFNPDHTKHFPNGELAGGEFVTPFERPERVDYIIHALAAQGLPAPEPNDPVDMTAIQQIHSADFIAFLETVWADWVAEGHHGQAIPTTFPTRGFHHDRIPKSIIGRLGYYCLASETAITSGTWQAAIGSAAAAQTAQRIVANGARTAFALCRPPGHHASTSQFGGYCFLNNAAIAAQMFLNDGAKRVAILDVDYHHGNGTQDIFYARDDVFFASLHCHPENEFPYFLGYADEIGTGPGTGTNLNLPMRPGTDFAEWSKSLEIALAAISDFAPSALVVSLGVDAFKDDPISLFRLTSADFTTTGAMIAKAKLPTLFVMEGGYAISEIGTNTVNMLTGFINQAGA